MRFLFDRNGAPFWSEGSVEEALDHLGYARTDAFGVALRKLVSTPEERIDAHHGGCRVSIRVERVGDWVQTYSGGRWWPHDPRPEDVRFEDYPQLARVNRYGGATLQPYSDAQHSCLVHDLVYRWSGSKQERKEALLHDWHEIYPPGDQLRPTMVEDGLPEESRAGVRAIRAMVAGAKRAVREAFGLSPAMPQIVKRADNVALATERRFLLVPVPWAHGKLVDPDPETREIPFWDADRAAAEFLSRWEALR